MENKIKIRAVAENMSVVTDYLTECLEKKGIPEKHIYALNIAADEIFSNIAKYGFPHEAGDVDILVDVGEEGVRMTFSDTGIPFDPLEIPDPDTTLSAAERDPGGLGIFMVKKLMDKTEYRYENGRNVMSVFKNTVTVTDNPEKTT